MDGCFAFWELGCRIDWQAWSALGTFAAVLVALGVAFSEWQSRRISENQEARIIASMLGHEFLGVGARLAGIMNDLATDNPQRSTFLAAMKGDRRFRESALQRMRNASHLPRTENALSRLHVLPANVAAEVLHAVRVTKYLTLETIPYGRAVDRGDTAEIEKEASSLFDSLLHTIEVVGAASDACDKLGEELVQVSCHD